MKNKKNTLLLLEDIVGLGQKGDVVTAKAGYIRNFLLPNKKAKIADAFTLRLRENLIKQRQAQAIIDKKDSFALAERLKEMKFSVKAKTDPEGRLYGSITTQDVAKLAQEQAVSIEKHHVLMAHPFKKIGNFSVALKLKEGVDAVLKLEIVAEDPSILVSRPVLAVKTVLETPENSNDDEEEQEQE